MPLVEFCPIFYFVKTMLYLPAVTRHICNSILMIIARPILPELINLLWLPRFLGFIGVYFLFRLVI